MNITSLHLWTTGPICYGVKLFHDGSPYNIETSSLICRPSQWTEWFLYDQDLCHERVKKSEIRTPLAR